MKFISQKQKVNLELFFALFLLLTAIGFTLYQNLTLNHHRHYSLLAESFLQGRTDIQEKPEMLLDTVVGTDGRSYFMMDPFSGVLMVPFVLLLGHRAPQGYLDFMVTLLGIFILNKLLLTFEGTKKVATRLWFILIFYFASSVISIIWSAQPWFLAQNIGLMFALWGILEWRSKRRFWVLFILTFLLVVSRKNLIFPMGAYYFVSLLTLPGQLVHKASKFLAVVGGVIIGILVLMAYQTQGISKELLFTTYFPKSSNENIYKYTRLEKEQLNQIQQNGVWGWNNIPTNFVNHFLAGPVIIKEGEVQPGKFFKYTPHSHIEKPYLFPDRDGISMFYLSPVFLALLFLSIPNKKEILAPLAGFLSWGIVYLPNFASGSAQLGSRYTAEAIPFLFLMLVPLLVTHLGWRTKILTILSMVFNAFLILTLTNFYLNP